MKWPVSEEKAAALQLHREPSSVHALTAACHTEKPCADHGANADQLRASCSSNVRGCEVRVCLVHASLNL